MRNKMGFLVSEVTVRSLRMAGKMPRVHPKSIFFGFPARFSKKFHTLFCVFLAALRPRENYPLFFKALAMTHRSSNSWQMPCFQIKNHDR
jgi:hypothetical protein